jgi:hypothetical protein
MLVAGAVDQHVAIGLPDRAAAHTAYGGALHGSQPSSPQR